MEVTETSLTNPANQSNNKSISPVGWEKGRKKNAGKGEAPLGFCPAVTARSVLQTQNHAPFKHHPNALLAPPLSSRILRARLLGVTLPREGHDPANNDSAPPSAEKPVPFI